MNGKATRLHPLPKGMQEARPPSPPEANDDFPQEELYDPMEGDNIQVMNLHWRYHMWVKQILESRKVDNSQAL